MKKELFVGLFLLMMLAGAIVNIHFIGKLTDNVTDLISQACRYAGEENWQQAEEKAEAAASLWSRSDSYTHLVLRHPEVESVTDAIYAFLTQIYAHAAGGAEGAGLGAVARLQSISSIERIKLGSIF